MYFRHLIDLKYLIVYVTKLCDQGLATQPMALYNKYNINIF